MQDAQWSLLENSVSYLKRSGIMTSIYYQANRNYPLTQSEQEKIDQILKE